MLLQHHRRLRKCGGDHERIRQCRVTCDWRHQQDRHVLGDPAVLVPGVRCVQDLFTDLRNLLAHLTIDLVIAKWAV